MNLGLRSIARRTLLGDKYTEPVSCGLAAYRATIKVEEMEADPDTAWVAASNSLNLWYVKEPTARMSSIDCI